MTRFWTRFIHPFRKEKNKKKLPTVIFNDYATPPSYLKESSLYGYYLVRIEKLEYAYNMLLVHQNKKTYWKMMTSLLQIWYSELEKVNQQSRTASIMLQTQLDDLSEVLGNISSPIKNRDRRSLKKVQQFITTHLKEWDADPNHKTSSSPIILNDTTPIRCNKAAGMTSTSDHHTLFLETAKQHRSEAELRDSEFKSYYGDVERRIGQEIGSKNQKLTQCIRQVYRLQQDLYLHHRYITSQFNVLWDLGIICLNSLEDNKQEPKLFEAIKMKWQQQYHHQSKVYQDLKSRFKEVLKSNTIHREDFTCAICLSVLCEPVTLTNCYHTFCKSCIQQMYCAYCYRQRAKTMNRISENLGILILRPPPVVHCTCYIIDRISGELILKRDQQKAACPLCRINFEPDQCTEDLALEKFISLYFPKRKNDDEEMHEGDDNKEEKNSGKKKGSNSSTPRNNQRGETESGSRSRRHMNASKFYSKINRWSSNKERTSESVSVTRNNATPASSSRHVRNDMFSLARQTWMF